MDFLADQTIPETSIEEIRALGNRVDVRPVDEPTERTAQLERARRQGRVLLTFDFAYHADIFDSDAARPPGVVVFQLDYETPRDPAHLLSAILSEDDLEVDGQFTVIEGERLRQRPL